MAFSHVDPVLSSYISSTKWIHFKLLSSTNLPTTQQREATTAALVLIFPRTSEPCIWETINSKIRDAEECDFSVHIFGRFADAVAKLVCQWLDWDAFLAKTMADFVVEFGQKFSSSAPLEDLSKLSGAYAEVKRYINHLDFSLSDALKWDRHGFKLGTTRMSRLVTRVFDTCRVLMSAQNLVGWMEWFAELESRMAEFKLAGIHRKAVLMASLLADFEAYRAWRKVCMYDTPCNQSDLTDHLRAGGFSLANRPLKRYMQEALAELLSFRTQLMAPDFERLFPHAQPDPVEWVSVEESCVCVICTDTLTIGVRYCGVCKPCPLMHYECFRGYAWDKLRGGGPIDRNSTVRCPTCRIDFKMAACAVSARLCTDKRPLEFPEREAKRMHVAV